MQWILPIRFPKLSGMTLLHTPRKHGLQHFRGFVTCKVRDSHEHLFANTLNCWTSIQSTALLIERCSCLAIWLSTIYAFVIAEQLPWDKKFQSQCLKHNSIAFTWVRIDMAAGMLFITKSIGNWNGRHACQMPRTNQWLSLWQVYVLREKVKESAWSWCHTTTFLMPSFLLVHEKRL